MNSKQLKCFVSVAESRSFSKAAEQHYMTQAAVTQQVRKLESLVGAELINRKSRPISLTPMGEIFLREAHGILMRMDTAVQHTREASTGLSGTLRIGYTKGYEHSHLPAKLRRFHHDFPQVLVTCCRCDTDVLANGLINDEYDVIFTWDSTNICQNPQIEVRLQEKVPLVVALYGAHPLARHTSLTRKDLKNEILLFMTPSSTGDSLGDNHFIRMYQKAGYQPNILMRSNDVESILMMISAEEGISVLPSSCVHRLSEADNLVFVPLEGENETEDILAVWKKDNRSPSLQQFLSRLS